MLANDYKICHRGLVYCLLLGAWHQNIRKKVVKWWMGEREKIKFQNLIIGVWLRDL